MSAKDAPIALRSHQTLVGVIDKWRARRAWIHQRVALYDTTSLAKYDPWLKLQWAAEMWELDGSG